MCFCFNRDSMCIFSSCRWIDDTKLICLKRMSEKCDTKSNTGNTGSLGFEYLIFRKKTTTHGLFLIPKTNVPPMPLAEATTVFKIHFELLKWSQFIEMLLIFVIANERTYVTFMIVQKKKKKLFFLLHFSDSCFIVFVVGFLELWTHGSGWDIGKNDRSHNNDRPGCNMVSEFTRFK